MSLGVPGDLFFRYAEALFYFPLTQRFRNGEVNDENRPPAVEKIPPGGMD
jgi:hypothetical protein